MPAAQGVPLTPRSLRIDLTILLGLCAVLYFLFPTTHGLTNWQEGIRSLVAMQMDERGAWVTPTVHGQPYLAKPPMVYWLQLALARATGTDVGILHLRLVVAMAATLGVLLTYLAGRRLLRSIEDVSDDANGSESWADHAAFWSAAMLATGILYARSGRIGELDILLVPFVVGGAWAGFEAWRSHLVRTMMCWRCVAMLLLCGVGASLTKGPPGAMVLLFASCMGPLLQQAWRCVREPSSAPAKELFWAWWRLHPVTLAIAALGALWGWGRLVAHDIGDDRVRAAAQAEAADNLRIFVAEAPLNNLEASAYGVGLGSIAAIVALVWLVKDRPRLPVGAWAIAAWLGLSLIAMSVLGKGVARYLTPVWPAIALLGGMWLASAIRDLPIGRLLQRASLAIVVALAIGQGLWYGLGREMTNSQRSPKHLIAELQTELQSSGAALVAIDMWHPAIDAHAGRFVEPFFLCGPETHFTTGPGRTLDELRALAARQPVIALMRSRQPPNEPANAALADPPDLLRAAGFGVTKISTDTFFRVDSFRTQVNAYRVSVDQTSAQDPGG